MYIKVTKTKYVEVTNGSFEIEEIGANSFRVRYTNCVEKDLVLKHGLDSIEEAVKFIEGIIKEKKVGKLIIFDISEDINDNE